MHKHDIEKFFIRGFASFGGKCPLACNHCYTFINDFNSPSPKSIEDIVDALSRKNLNYDIIYISGYYENFLDENKGLDLCYSIFEKFRCDILITTRMTFSCAGIESLGSLSKRMRNINRNLYLCSSIPALQSYRKLEPSKKIPSPEERLSFLESIHNHDIFTFLTLRPLFPNKYIPTKEVLEIILKAKHFADIVLTSGVVLHRDILKKLPEFYLENFETDKLMSCLENQEINVQYVTVDSELAQIKNYCYDLRLPYFNESLLAVKFLQLYGNDRSGMFNKYINYIDAIDGDANKIQQYLSDGGNNEFWSFVKKSNCI